MAHHNRTPPARSKRSSRDGADVVVTGAVTPAARDVAAHQTSRGHRPRLQQPTTHNETFTPCIRHSGNASFGCSCSRVRSGAVDATAVRVKLDAIPLEQPVHFTNEKWQAILSPAQFYVMRRAGTERPSKSGKVLEHRTGTYVCSACGNPLYSAETKFDSGTGWPSFWQPNPPGSSA